MAAVARRKREIRSSRYIRNISTPRRHLLTKGDVAELLFVTS